MADSKRIMMAHKDVVEALIKHQGLHEGVWSLAIEFGIGAITAGESGAYHPTAMVPVLRIGLTPVEGVKEGVNNLTVDAARVNPQRLSKKVGKKKSAK